jgi:enoyl-CoA hydratase/carnithine racemase
MTYKYLTISKENHVATCVMSNPPTHTMVAAEVSEIHQFLDDIDGDKNIRAVLFKGAQDGIFITHYEVGELANNAEKSLEVGASAPKATPKLHAMNRLCLRLERMDAITIAAINGNAAGGGCELTLACDFRLMMDGKYRYGLPETSVGIIPGAGGTQRMARMLGTAKALDLILHAKTMSPATALNLGLIHRLYPEESFHADVDAFVEDIANRAPVALVAAKHAIHQGVQLPMEDALALEQAQFGKASNTKDAAGVMRVLVNGQDTRSYKWLGE